MGTIKSNFNFIKKFFRLSGFVIPLFILFFGFTINAQQNTKGIRTIILIRHGQYSPQSDALPDSVKKLTPLGIAQARLTAERLKSMGIHFDALISSTMQRAKETAMVINQDFPELKLKQSDLIRECTPPSWRKDVMAGVDTTEKEKCVESLEAAFKKYFIPSPDNNDRNDIIVCHGNVIRYLVTKVLKVNTMAWLQMSISNCSLTIVEIMPNGTARLDAYGDYGHIPENMRTFTGGNNKGIELRIDPGTD